MQHGSLNNLCYARYSLGGLVTPEVGMGATRIGWTDRAPFTVIEVSKTGKTIKVQMDNYTRTDKNGMSDSGQTYEYTRNPEGEVYTLRMTKRGWAYKSIRFSLGQRDCYHDYSF